MGRRAVVFAEGYVESSWLYRFVYLAALASSRVRALVVAAPPSRLRSAVLARVYHRLFEDWSDGKLARVMRAIHHEAELELPGGLGTFRGEDAVRRGWDEFQEAFPGARMSLREWIDGEDGIAVVCLVSELKGGTSGIELDDDIFGVWELRDGSGIRLRLYGTKTEALEAVGLSE